MSNIDKIEFEVDGAFVGGPSKVHRINAVKYKCRARNNPFKFTEALGKAGIVIKITEYHVLRLHSDMDDARFFAIEDEVLRHLG